MFYIGRVVIVGVDIPLINGFLDLREISLLEKPLFTRIWAALSIFMVVEGQVMCENLVQIG